MNVLLILTLLSALCGPQIIRALSNFKSRDSPIYISVETEAEIKSLALQNRLGSNRRYILEEFLDQVNIIEINKLNPPANDLPF